MNVCKRHEGAIIVYSPRSCPLCSIWEILEASDQKMSWAMGMVNRVRGALEKNSEEYFTPTLDAAGDFIGKAREGVSQVVKILSGKILEEEEKL